MGEQSTHSHHRSGTNNLVRVMMRSQNERADKMKSPLYNYKNRFLFSNIWKTAAVEALCLVFFSTSRAGCILDRGGFERMFLFSSCAVRLHSNSSPCWCPAALTANDTVSSFKWFQRAFDERIRDIRAETQRPFCSLSQKTQNKMPNTHMHTQRTCLDRIIILYLLLTSPFHVHLRPLHPDPLLPVTVFTLWHRLQAVQGRSERHGLGIYFFFSFLFSYQKKGPHLQRRLHLNTEHKDMSRGIFYFLISLLPACWVCIQTAWAQICMAKGVIMCRSPAALSFNFTGFHW